MAMEIENVGVMYYSALVPCVISALTAQGVAEFLGATGEQFAVNIVPEFTATQGIYTGFLALLCAVVSVLFCQVLKFSGKTYKKLLPNPYLRVFVGGCIVVALTYISGTRLYNGAGMNVIEMAIKGEAPAWAFLLKIIFTALTLGAYPLSYDMANGNYFTATLLAACVAAVFANVSAFAFKTSPTAFLTMCIYPMLPGSELYRLVYSIIMDDRVGYHEHGRKIFLICMAIALGYIIVEVLYKYTRFITHRNKE